MKQKALRTSYIRCASKRLLFWMDAFSTTLMNVGIWTKHALNYSLTLSLPSSNSTFSQPHKEKCICEEVRIGSTIIFHPSKPWKVQVLHTVCYVIFLMRLQRKIEMVTLGSEGVKYIPHGVCYADEPIDVILLCFSLHKVVRSLVGSTVNFDISWGPEKLFPKLKSALIFDRRIFFIRRRNQLDC